MKGRVALLVSIAAILGYALLRSTPTTTHHRPPPSSLSTLDTTEFPAAQVAAVPIASVHPLSTETHQSAPTAAASSGNASTLDEPATMKLLRELGDSMPTMSLALAREANRRFPNSADAAERGFYICKSLVNLERFQEAQEEARVIVERFRGTPWAEDLERHLLVNPLELSER